MDKRVSEEDRLRLSLTLEREARIRAELALVLVEKAALFSSLTSAYDIKPGETVNIETGRIGANGGP